MAPSEWDLLLSAAQKNQPDRIREMIAQGVDPNHSNAVGQSALHIASLWGNVASVQALLEAGADSNAVNTIMGSTPLHMTAQSGKGDPSDHLAVAELLLRHGACLNIADDRNRIPLDYAREQVNHSPEFVQLLQLHAPPVFKAIQEGDLPTLTNLLASVDTLSELNNSKHNGVVALVWSIEKLVTATEVKGDPFKVQQYYLILKELMDRGANPDQQAREGDDPPLFQLLQALRQTLKKQLDEYSRVLKDTIVLLVETGGISITPDSQQLLHQATRRNEIQFAQFMIEKLEIDPNLPGRQGITALQFASRSGQIAMVNYLLSLDNIQVDATDETGQTALDAARVNGKETIIQAIEDYMKLRRLSVTIPS